MQDLDHKHLFIGAKIATPMKTPEEVESWLNRLVAAVGMKLLMPAKAERCDTEGNEGVTGIVLLETSHASIHIWETASVPFLNLDIYSCKRFDPQVVCDLLKEFDPYFYSYTLMDRNNNTQTILEDTQIQVAKIIDMLDEETKQHYLAAHKAQREKKPLTKEQKKARAVYGSFASRYSLSNIKRYNKRKNEHKLTLSSIKQRCVAKDLDFDLDSEWYENEFQNSLKKWPKLTTHGTENSFWRGDVDRIDSTKGYTKDNCRIIPHALNVAKWNWNSMEFKELADLIANELK